MNRFRYIFRLTTVFFIALGSVFPLNALAETRSFFQVWYVLESNSFLQPFPGEEPFVITGAIDYTITRVQLRIAPLLQETCSSETEPAGQGFSGQWEGRSKQFFIQIPPLKEASRYCVRFEVEKQQHGDSEQNQIRLMEPVMVRVPGRNYYVSLDLGVLMTPAFDDALPYLGANFYFDRINKDIPLREDDGFWKRTSLVVGVTLGQPRDSTIKPLLEDRMLLTGAGFRITDDLKLGMGVIYFKQRHSNPLVDQSRRNVSGYLSLSLDVDLYGMFQRWNPFELTETNGH
ncbi:MAG: hypothetical protein HQM12_20860 [SAR324 cluster bacterium]|nr:hypothetical protein [SAR324 cluster bacterium]